MSTYAYAIRTVAELLGKAERELRRMNVATDPTAQADHALNFAITAWHIVDWLWKSAEPAAAPARAKLGINSLDDLHSLVRRECPELHMCYQLATGAKHLELSEKLKRAMREPVVVEATHTTTGSFSMAEPFPPPLKVVLEDGSRLRADEVFEAVLKYWRAFLARGGM